MSILWQKLKRSQGSVHAECEVRFEPFHWWYLLMIITLSWELKLLSFIYNKKPTHKNGVALSVLQYETTLSPISESSVGPAVSPWVGGWGSWPVERNDVTCEHWTELKCFVDRQWYTVWYWQSQHSSWWTWSWENICALWPVNSGENTARWTLRPMKVAPSIELNCVQTLLNYEDSTLICEKTTKVGGWLQSFSYAILNYCKYIK